MIKLLIRVGNSLIGSFAHRSFAQIKWATVSDSLRLLRTNEQLWANRSGHSCQKSDHEQIASVAHDKWVTMSDSLRSLMINEQMSESLVFSERIAHLLVRSKKQAIRSKNLTKVVFFGTFFVRIFLNQRFAHSLLFNERCERLAQVAHQKWANERIESLVSCVNPSFAHFLRKKRAIRSENWLANS